MSRGHDALMARVAASQVGSQPTMTMRTMRLPSAPPPVRIVATTARFFVDGEQAEVGVIYTVAPDIAEGLVALGKAKWA